MDKHEALKKAIEKKREQNAARFADKVESLVWAIEKKSQELRDLKKELTELSYEEIDIPDISDYIK